MATAKDDLAEIPGAGTVREAVVELYDNPDKYIGLNEQSLRRNPSDFLTGLSRMERNALGLFQAVNAWEPVYGPVDQEEFLTRLGPFLDKKLDMNKPASFFSVVQEALTDTKPLGYVDVLTSPDTAVVLPTGPLDRGPASTLFHELDHTSQADQYGRIGFGARKLAPASEREEAVMARAGTLLEEARKSGDTKMLAALGDGYALTNPLEFGAEMSTASQMYAARNKDFLESQEGQALFPTPEDKAYYYGSTMPGVPSAYPSQGTFVPEERPAARDKSYARQMFEMLPKFQEGGEATGRAPRRRGPPAGQRGQAAADLEQLGKQAGLFGLGFAPGAGIADYFGQFPSAQGGTEPSAVENFQQGNYGTAAMQGLGAMGDLALTVPVAGAAIGSVMKAPRAAQRMLKELPVGGKRSAEELSLDVSTTDASDIFGQGAQQVKYQDQDSKGFINVLVRPDGTASVLGLEVPEQFRKQGIGEKLQAQVMQDFPVMQGQVSSKAAATSAYRLGRRPIDNPDATLEDVFKRIDEDSSVNLVSPETFERMQAPRAADQGPLPTDTKEFKNWFKGSAVATPKGEPMMLYHSTFSDFPEFKTNFEDNEYFQFGAHVGPVDAASNRLSMKQAEDAARGVPSSMEGANIMPVYVNIKKPLRLDENRSGRWGVDDIMSAIMEKADKGKFDGISPEDVDDYFNDTFDIEQWLDVGFDPNYDGKFWGDMDEFAPGERSELLKDFIRQLGFDGIVYKNEFEGGGDSFIALNPKQIKSAFNRGTYDPKDPRILYGAGAGLGAAGIMGLTAGEAEAASENPNTR